jgi:hypothetical protein
VLWTPGIVVSEVLRIACDHPTSVARQVPSFAKGPAQEPRLQVALGAGVSICAFHQVASKAGWLPRLTATARGLALLFLFESERVESNKLTS